MRARQLWIVGEGRAELRQASLPEPGVDAVRVRTLASGISRGTERLVFAGRVPDSQHAAMRAPLQAGEFPWPVHYGYAAVGVVETGDQAGTRVFCLAPHADRFVAPATLCVPVPDAVPTARAVLAANLETAVNLLWDARPLLGERALVVGAGVIGLLAAWLLARLPAIDLAVCDPDPAARDRAAALGLATCEPAEAPAERELLLHASGTAAGLRLCLERAAFEARIVEASWFGEHAVALPLGHAFHARRLRLISSQVGAVAAPMRGRRTHRERLALALALLDDPALDALLGPPTRFGDLPGALPTLLAPGAAPCPLVTYP